MTTTMITLIDSILIVQTSHLSTIIQLINSLFCNVTYRNKSDVLKCTLINARSICSKLSELHYLLYAENYDVLLLKYRLMGGYCVTVSATKSDPDAVISGNVPNEGTATSGAPSDERNIRAIAQAVRSPVKLPGPSATARASISSRLSRIARCSKRATLAETKSMAAALGQAATQAPQPMQVAASKARVSST